MGEQYLFTTEVEEAVVLAECTVPRFHDLIGNALDPESMQGESQKLLVMAAQGVHIKSSSGACDSRAVMQYLYDLLNEGKLKRKQYSEAEDYLTTAQDFADVGDVEALVDIAVRVVKRVGFKKLVPETIEAYGKNVDPLDIANKFPTWVVVAHRLVWTCPRVKLSLTTSSVRRRRTSC